MVIEWLIKNWINKADSSWIARMGHSWYLKMTREDWRSKDDMQMCGASGSECFCQTWQAEVREELVSFWELTARSDKVKMSVEHEPRRYKEKKVYEPPSCRYAPKEALDSVDKRVRTRKKLKVCVYSLFPTMIYSLFLASWLYISCFYTLFLSPGNSLQVAVVNKPLSSLTVLCSFTFYHGEVTTGIKKSLWNSNGTIFQIWDEK